MTNFKLIEKIADINSRHRFLFQIISVILIFLSISTTLYSKIFVENNFKINVLFGIFALGIVTIFSIGKNKPKLTKTGILILIFLEIIGISYFITSLQFKVIGYMAMALVFMVGIPIIQYALATSEDGYILNLFTQSILISYVCFFIFSLLCGPPLTSMQYKSVLSNPQFLALYLIIVTPSYLYQIHRMGLSNFRKNILFIGLISALTLTVFSSSRTGMVTVIGELLLIIIFDIKTIFSKKYSVKIISRSLIKQIIIKFIIVLIVPIIMFFLLTTVKFGIENHLPSIQIRVDEIQRNDKSSTTGFSKFGKSLNRFDQGLEEDINAVTSGRTYIWKSFCENIGIKGHEKEGRIIVTPKYRYKEPKTAHNVYIQVAYSAGIIAGISYLILVTLVGLKMLYWIYKNIRDQISLNDTKKFASCFFLGFAMISLVESAYFPFMGLPATMFFISSYTFVYDIEIVDL